MSFCRDISAALHRMRAWSACGVLAAAATAHANQPPAIQPIPPQQVSENQTLLVAPVASDPDGDVLTWTGSGLPSGASVNAGSGALTWTPGFTQSGLYNGIVLTAADGHGGEAAVSLSIGVINVNRPPTVATIPTQTVNEAAALVVTPSASDPDGDVLHWWGDTTLPGGTVDQNTGAWNWAPDYTRAGTYNGVGLVCSDGQGGVVTATFKVVVNDVNRLPVVGPIANRSVMPGYQLRLSATVSDPDGDTVVWSGQRLPSGASVNAITGVFSWTPSVGQIGTYSNIALKATDAKGGAASSVFNITVRAVNRAPSVSHIPDFTLHEGSTLSFTASGSDPDGDSLKWTGKKMPPLATLDSLTGAFAWTIQFTEAGNDYDSIRVYARDPYGAENFTLFSVTVIDSNATPLLDPLDKQTVAENTLLTVVPSGHDPDSTQTVTWSGANLPAGAAVDPVTGVLTWRPAYGQAGTYNSVEIRLTDPWGAWASEVFTITVLRQLPEHFFGTFRNQTISLAALRMNYLGASWTYRDIRPLLDVYDWQVDADLTDSSTCAAGTQMVFNLIAADSLSAGNRYLSRKPADQAQWDSIVRTVVERYDGDGIDDMPGLPCPVHTWHIEEEGTFWVDTDANYVAHFNQTAAVIRDADPQAQVVLMGISSDQAWNAAWYAGFVKQAPPSFLWIREDSLAAFVARTATLLAQCDYDVVDLHSYETTNVLQGKLAWVRSLMAQPAPVWCFEGGGPYVSRDQGYTDTLNAYMVFELFAEALANGAERYTFPYLQPTSGNWDDAPGYDNIPLTSYGLFCDGSACTKPSYESFRVLTQHIADFTSARDLSPRISGFAPDSLYRMRFATTHGPVDIVWAGTGTRTVTYRMHGWTPGAFSTTLRVTHPVVAAGLTADEAVTEFIPFVQGYASLTVTDEPVIVEGPFDTTFAVAGGGRSTQAAFTPPEARLRASAAGGMLHVRWSVPEPPRVVQVDVFSAGGRRIATTALGEVGGAREGEVAWSVRDAAGRALAPGVYWLRLRADDRVRATARVVWLR